MVVNDGTFDSLLASPSRQSFRVGYSRTVTHKPGALNVISANEHELNQKVLKE